MTDLKAQILEILDGPEVYEIEMQDGTIGTQILADRLVALFNGLNEHNVCDFDCDNCHMGGCGNPLCDRAGCPEENAARVEFDKKIEGHTVLGCQICGTAVCRVFDPKWTDK